MARHNVPPSLVSATTRAFPRPLSGPASTPSTASRHRRTRQQPRLRRGVLPFAPTSSLQFNYADAVDMDEIITSGSVAAALHPEFGAQDKTMDTTGDIDGKLDDTEEAEGEDDAVEVEPEPVPQKKGRKRKRAANAKPGEPAGKWTSKEDECLTEA
ncbi:putative methionyl-tRNA synthetase [Hordeum vulgare]|nr:putative methionyl-tRNA synthetase [Hordeum vulgare]